MTNLYFIRHAESEFIHGKEIVRGITEDGHKKSKQIAKKLYNVNFNAIISSTYKRAIETVKPLAESNSLQIKTYNELIERPIKGLDYRLEWNKIEQAIEKSFFDIDYCLDGGESTRKAQERSIPTILELLERYTGKSIAIGTHGNIMTIILKYFNNDIGFKFWKDSKKPDIYKVSFKNRELIKIENIPLN